MNRVWVAVAVVLATASAGAILPQITADADRTTTNVQLEEDGDATVAIVTSVDLPNESELAAFEDLQAGIEAEDSAYRQRFRDAVEGLVSRANASTGRRMAATNVTVETRIEPLPVRRGVVEYRFRWAGFAARDGDRIVAADALSGYLLGESESLVVTVPADYEVTSAVPEPDRCRDGSVRWQGPRSFDGDRPRVVAEATGTGGAGGDDGGFAVMPWIAVLVLVTAVAVGLVLYRRRPSTPEMAGMTDEERVVEMVDEAGGRIKQKQIEENTDWSAAKVSQVTSRLEEDGEIEKLRMGRENIIRFPEDDEL